ncbi:retrovirus-related pol polyprotein from transposon TNT 1-94 [Tanacetum coccineum]
MTLDIHNWSSSVHQEIHNIVKDEIFPIVNQVDARVQNFEIQFLKEAAKFVRDFQSLAKEADESLSKHKALGLEIERLLRAVIERLQAQLENQKGKSKDTRCVSDTPNPLTHKLENENVELEFHVQNYEKENAHLKTAYKNLFDSINVTRAQTKLLIDSLQNKLHDTIYENAKLRAQLFDKVPQKVDKTNDLSNPVTSNSVPTTKESKVVENDKVIAPGMFRINPFNNSKEVKFVPNKPVNTSVRTNPITDPQPHVITKKVVNSDSHGFSSTGVDITTKTRRPQPRSNTKNDRVPSASKSSRIKNKEVKVEDHPRNLLLSKNKKHMLTECNNIKLAIWNDKSKIVCAMWSKERLASPKPSKPRMRLRWSPTGKMFDIKGKLIAFVIQIRLWCVDSVCSKHMTENLKLLINFVWKFLGTVCFRNDHVAAILGFGDLQWGNILITRVYFVEGLGYNLFSIGQFCDSGLDVAFRRNTCFVRNLKGVDLLIGNRTTNLYTINLHDMASASPICLMARATYTKSWLWHQCLSYLNFNTINDLSRNDLVTGLPKFKYHKEHLCPSCEQGKSKRASHPPKPVPNSRKRLHLLHMDLYGPMRITSINRKRYVLVIVDDYSRYTRVIFLRSKDEAPEEIKTFLKKITVLLQAPVIINNRKDIGKLGAKGDIGFFISYSSNSSAYRVYNRRTNKIMETINVTFDELSAMAFEQSSLKPGLQSMTSGQISSRLNLPYAPSTITTQTPTEVLQTPTTTTTIADTAPTPTNSSSQATNFPNTSQDVDELEIQQQHVQHQPKTIVDNVPNAMFDDNTFANPFATPSSSAAESSSS